MLEDSTGKKSSDPRWHEWLLKRFSGGASNYWSSYVADVCIAFLFMAWEVFVWHSHPGHVIAGRIAGFLGFTLSEYVLHRWAYHRFRGFIQNLHSVHHVEPQGLIATPWVLTTVLFVGFWCLIRILTRGSFYPAMFSGWQIGIVWYGFVHHSHHHWDVKNAWIRKVKVHHLVHHKFPDSNFGISSRFWDTVFGTRYRRQAAPQGLTSSSN